MGTRCSQMSDHARDRMGGRAKRRPDCDDSERQRGTRIARSRSAGRLSIWWTRRSPPFAQYTHTLRNILVVFMCMRRGKSRTKQTKKAIYYSLKKRVLSALSDGPGPLLLLFSPPPSLLLFLSSFSYTLLFSFPFLFTLLLFSLSFNTFSFFFSRISIKHRKSASFLASAHGSYN